ncbi:MAG: hypothetical protein JW991_01795 [Candidatus Pacebacteria bacterium]|nr:hypothetical protein [Candidatus Paceibacterota bacterium]
MAKILHCLPDDEAAQARDVIRLAQENFWADWAPWRCGLAGEGKPGFDDVMRFLPGTGPFARDFVNPQKGDLVVDLFGGTGTLATYFTAEQRRTMAGYITIDQNGQLKQTAEAIIGKAGVRNGHFLAQDLGRGLPSEIRNVIRKIDPDQVLFVSNFGMTYLPAQEFQQLAGDCFSPEFTLGRPTTLNIHMLRDGRFDPVSCKEHFMSEIVPRNILKSPAAVVRAIRAVKRMTQFGFDVQDVNPVWYPRETTRFLTEIGLSVIRRDETLVWGQSIAMEAVPA